MALVLLERLDSVAIVTLNRPQRHNSLVPELLQDFLEALNHVHADSSVRAVVLQANGRSFSTGGDVQGFVDHADNIEPYAQQIVGLLNEAILMLIDLPVPVVTAVHGIVTGGALGFILGSDLVLLAPEASFTPYYSVVGPSPDGGWGALLPLFIGRWRAAELLYLNQTLDAETAVAWGVANRIVPPGKIRAEALRVAQQIAAMKPGSIRHTKRLLALDRDEIADRLASEQERFIRQMGTGEVLEGFQDFLHQLKTSN